MPSWEVRNWWGERASSYGDFEGTVPFMSTWREKLFGDGK
jgi:hypothetical protein